MSSKPVRYKTSRWLNKRKRILCWGIVGLLEGEWVNIKEGKRAKFYEDINQAVKRVKQLNKELLPHNQNKNK